MTSRRYVFTINNPTAEDLATIENVAVRYICYQLEVGSEGGVEHIQGWVVWDSPVRLRQCRNWLGGRGHVEVQRGSDDEAYDYVTKSETRISGPWERGTRPRGQGSRSDLSAIQTLILNGGTDRQLGELYFASYIRYHRGIAAFRANLPLRRRVEPPIVNIFWGTTGTGKTKKCYDDADDDAFWMMRGNWFDGYDSQKHVIIDDFYGWMPYSQLLRILDRYPIRVPVKGGSTPFIPEEIWITSNQDPREWYNYREGMEWETLKRRITNIVHFNSPLGE